MPFFGSKEKKAKKALERSDSWSLGKTNVKSNRNSTSDMAFGRPKSDMPPPQILEMGTGEDPLRKTENVKSKTDMPPPEILEMGTGEDPPRQIEEVKKPETPATESNKSFAAELDSSTISSLPPSHRDGGSVTGSEVTRVPSTKATSVTSAPSDRLNQELYAPDYSEKEVVVSRGPMPQRTPSSLQTPSIKSPGLSQESTMKETYVPSRPESSIFSLPLSTQQSIARGYREYNYYNTPNFKDLVVCDPSQRAMFFAEVSSHTRSKADIALREFSEDLSVSGTKSMSLNEKDIAKTRIVATADFVPNENAKQIKLGIGDPLDPASNTWVVMRNVTPDNAREGYEKFEMVVPGMDGNTLLFHWIKGATGDTDDSDSSAKEAYRLVCDDNTVASFRNTSMTNVRKRGSLRVFEGQMLEQYLLLFFLSGSAMSEMYRRRRCKKVIEGQHVWTSEDYFRMNLGKGKRRSPSLEDDEINDDPWAVRGALF